MDARTLTVLTALLSSAPPLRAAPAQERGRPAGTEREEISALELRLEQAIGRVSVPHLARVLGRESARGYRLPGYGLVLVLTPRALPAGDDVLFRRHVPARRQRARPPAEPAPEPALPEAVESLERQVVILQAQTERSRRAAEEDMERIVQDLRFKLAIPHEELESRPRASPIEEGSLARAGSPAVGSEEPAEATAPPWKFWFPSAVARDERTEEALVADVRRALVDVLATPVAVTGLAGDEFVTVAVDFEPAGPFASRRRAERTLLVRARAKDIQARARGAIGDEALRRRIEVIEY